jgi:tRNA1Val (adenine37-N6)-methyltransferase
MAETVDELREYGLRIRQPRHGYRFSLDPLLLVDFAAVQQGERVIDLGTGCGVIPLVLARMVADARIVGVEVQPHMAELAAGNIRDNNLADRVEVLTADILALKQHYKVSSFDLVVANPPFRRRGTGRVSPKQGRDDARHESTAGLGDFLAAAKYLVKPAGRICFIHHPSRLEEFIAEAVIQKLSLVRLRLIHGNLDCDASIFLAELVKGRKGELKVLPPLFINNNRAGLVADSQALDGVDQC